MSHILSDTLANVIPFTYLCPRLLSSAFVRFWLFTLPGYLFHGFHLLNNPLPLRQRKGFFFPPKHSHEKFFRKFFQITPRRLFADFLARICDEGNGCLPLAIGGGTPFVGLWACGLVVAPLLCLSRSHLLRLFSLWASVPYWLTASGSLRDHRGIWSCCVPRFVGWCWASVPRSCSDSLGSLRA